VLVSAIKLEPVDSSTELTVGMLNSPSQSCSSNQSINSVERPLSETGHDLFNELLIDMAGESEYSMSIS